jgi:hypothetical protein
VRAAKPAARVALIRDMSASNSERALHIKRKDRFVPTS